MLCHIELRTWRLKIAHQKKDSHFFNIMPDDCPSKKDSHFSWLSFWFANRYGFLKPILSKVLQLASVSMVTP